MNILIVEDDKESAKILQKVLKAEKYSAEVSYSYSDARELLLNNQYSLVLLDWNLGDTKGDGYDLLCELRELSIDTPVLMITSESAVTNKVSVFDAGADDYLCKPYSNIELLARIRALLRRETKSKVSLVKFDRVTLDTVKREITLDNELLNLTTTEYDLFELFLQNPNVVLTRYQLNEHITKDYASMTNSNLVDVHIKNLRKKLHGYDIFKSVRGVGYTLKL
ncbi:response regulator transcription factor [Sulfurimonas sp.]